MRSGGERKVGKRMLALWNFDQKWRKRRGPGIGSCPRPRGNGWPASQPPRANCLSRGRGEVMLAIRNQPFDPIFFRPSSSFTLLLSSSLRRSFDGDGLAKFKPMCPRKLFILTIILSETRERKFWMKYIMEYSSLVLNVRTKLTILKF